MGRHFLGFELVDEYYEFARARLADTASRRE
jgi:DNA modification methylase